MCLQTSPTHLYSTFCTYSDIQVKNKAHYNSLNPDSPCFSASLRLTPLEGIQTSSAEELPSHLFLSNVAFPE